MSYNDLFTSCGLTATNFNRTPDNLIFTDDLKKIYSILIICLKLEEKSKSSQKKLLNVLNKSYPYTFSTREAIEEMSDLKLYMDINSTIVHISYSLSADQAYDLLCTFMDAKLLHTPADRTRDEPKDNVLLQPTPKGIAILQRFVIQMGIKEKPPILMSAFNSMQLFFFERSSVNDAIIHSEYFIQLLFIKMMGTRPNIWSPTNSSEKLPTLAALAEQPDSTFTFENTSLDFTCTECKDGSSGLGSVPEKILKDTERESPFAHRFFTNPDSDSHVQYYVSDSGLRLPKARTFGKDNIVIKHFFSTKSLWQWLMDCTDLMYPRETVSIVALFYKAGLIVPILLPPSLNACGKFIISKMAYYTLSKSAWDIIQWNAEGKGLSAKTLKSQFLDQTENKTDFITTEKYILDLDEKSQNQFESDTEIPQKIEQKLVIDLNYILKDPGLRYLFRTHLEKEFCVENFDVYLEIKKFSKKMTILKNIINSKNATEKRNIEKHRLSFLSQKVLEIMNSTIIKKINECLAIAYHIFSTYITTGAPFELNINHELRTSITNIMINPESFSLRTFNKKDLNPFEENVIHPYTSYESLQINETYKSISSKSLFSRLAPKKSPTLIQATKTTLSELEKKSNDFSQRTILDFNNHFQIPSTSSPEILVNSLRTLKELYILFEVVGKHMYRLMKIDSVPKFLNSEMYREILALIDTSLIL